MTSTNSHAVGDNGNIKAEDTYQDPPIVMATAVLPPESTFERVLIDDDLNDPDEFFVAQETTPLVAVYSQSGSRRSNSDNMRDGDNGTGLSSNETDAMRNEEEDEKIGNQSGPVFRDLVFAVLFYIQLIGMLYAGIVYSPQGYENIDKVMNYTFIREQIELQSDDMTPEDWQQFDTFVSQVSDYISVYPIRIFLWTLLPGALFAFFFAHFIIMFVVPRFSTVLVKLSLLLPVPLLLAFILFWIIASPTIGSLLIAGLLGIVVVYYVRLVWPMIPFAAVNLKVATIGINANMGTHLWAFFSCEVSVIWVLFWLYATFGIMSYLDDQCAATNSTSSSTDKSGGDALGDPITRLLGTTSSNEDIIYAEDCGQGGIFFLLLLSGYWTSKVLTNVVQVTVAGVMATWCFDKEAARGCCSPAVASSLYRSATYSFGSICLGSLLQGIMQLLRKLLHNPRSRSDHNDATCCGLCFCIFECCGRVLEDALDYFNQWSYVFIGIYGYGYIESGKRVLELFVSKAWTSIISERLVSYVTGCITIAMGILTGLTMWAFTVLVDSMHENSSSDGVMDDSSPSIFYVYGVLPRNVSFVVGFVIGAIVTSVLMSVVHGAVNTLIVCFADSPARLAEEHPELTLEITDAWAEAFPETIQRNTFLQPPMAESVTV